MGGQDVVACNSHFVNGTSSDMYCCYESYGYSQCQCMGHHDDDSTTNRNTCNQQRNNCVNVNDPENGTRCTIHKLRSTKSSSCTSKQCVERTNCSSSSSTASDLHQPSNNSALFQHNNLSNDNHRGSTQREGRADLTGPLSQLQGASCSHQLLSYVTNSFGHYSSSMTGINGQQQANTSLRNCHSSIFSNSTCKRSNHDSTSEDISQTNPQTNPFEQISQPPTRRQKSKKDGNRKKKSKKVSLRCSNDTDRHAQNAHSASVERSEASNRQTGNIRGVIESLSSDIDELFRIAAFELSPLVSLEDLMSNIPNSTLIESILQNESLQSVQRQRSQDHSSSDVSIQRASNSQNSGPIRECPEKPYSPPQVIIILPQSITCMST